MPKEPKDAPPPYDVGDSVWVVYWRPFALLGQPDNGAWDRATARVVSVGRDTVCLALDAPSLPAWLDRDGEPAPGNPRFATRGAVFPTAEAADEAIRAKPPGKPQ